MGVAEQLMQPPGHRRSPEVMAALIRPRPVHGRPAGPVVMLNLLRFRPGGRASYEEYAREEYAREEYARQLAVTFLPRYGARVIYAGTGSIALVAEQGQAWDAVLLVRYPSWEAFS